MISYQGDLDKEAGDGCTVFNPKGPLGVRAAFDVHVDGVLVVIEIK